MLRICFQLLLGLLTCSHLENLRSNQDSNSKLRGNLLTEDFHVVPPCSSSSCVLLMRSVSCTSHGFVWVHQEGAQYGPSKILASLLCMPRVIYPPIQDDVILGSTFCVGL